MVFQPAIETKGCPLLLETNTQLRCLKEGKLQLPSLDVMGQQRLQQFSTCKVRKQQTYVHIYIYEGCSKFFHLENAIFAKKNLLSPNFRELHVCLSRYMLAKILKKNVDVRYPQIVPGVWSLVTLHSAAAALKHLRSALRCWSLLTFIGQFWQNKSTV